MESNVKKQAKILFFKTNRRIFSKKNLTLAILFFILINIYISPIKDFSILSGYNVTIWIYPFLISDANFLALFIAGVIYYFSDVPFMQKANSYYLLRQGRRSWMLEQLVYIVVSSFIITIVSILMSVFSTLPYVTFELDWGNVLYTLARTNAGQMVGMFWKISLHFIRNYNPVYGMLLSILLTIMGIVFLGTLMFFTSLYVNRTTSILVATFLVIYSAVVANIGNAYEKGFAMISPASWLRVTRINAVEYGYSVSPPLSYILICFSFLIILLIGFINRRCMKIDLIWGREDE